MSQLLSPFLCPPAWHFHVCHSVLGMTLQSRLSHGCFVDEETQTRELWEASVALGSEPLQLGAFL